MEAARTEAAVGDAGVTAGVPKTLSGTSRAISGRLGRRDAISRRLLAGADLVAMLVAATLASVVAGDGLELLWATLPTLPAWLVLFKIYGLYDRDVKRIAQTSVDDLPWLFHALVVGTLLMWGYTKLIDYAEISFAMALVFGLTALIASMAFRAIVRAAIPRVLGTERVLLVGTGSASATLVRKLGQHPEYGLETVGVLTAEQSPSGSNSNGLPVLGRTTELERVIEELGVRRVVICRPEIGSAEVIDVIDTCRRLTVKASILPDTVDAFGPSTEVDDVEGLPLLGVTTPVLSRTSRLLKRGFDAVVAGILLVLLAPLFLLMAAAIRLDSPGPVLFRQTRVGRGGRQFELLKFRTMSEDAEQRRSELLTESRDPNWLLLDRDPRVTRVGRFLRRTSLDETPQLWNVIRGEMSLVGPRPLPEAEDARVGGRERGRLDLTPGITGLWQVLGRTSIPFEEMVKLDYVYATNWSLWMDLRLLLKTLPAVLRSRGTN